MVKKIQKLLFLNCDKRSKLNLFERQSTLAIIPCYNDSDITEKFD